MTTTKMTMMMTMTRQGRHDYHYNQYHAHCYLIEMTTKMMMKRRKMMLKNKRMKKTMDGPNDDDGDL